MIGRVAYISVHTSPLEQPGINDAGGLNVYLHELAQTMAARGVAVEVLTRRTHPDEPETVEVVPGYTVVRVEAGPRRRLDLARLPDLVGEFAEGVIKWAYSSPDTYDVVHSHYWLSGWAGVLVKEALDIPLANSFHTLGRVKDATRRGDDPPAGLLRIAAERDVIALSECVVASTPAEFDDLMRHYEASPERLCLSPPGINHEVFAPGPKGAARARIGAGPGPLVLFVGRIQPLKGLDVAFLALEHLAARLPDVSLLVVGGPSGSQGAAELERVRGLAAGRAVSERVVFVGPQPHERLVDYYRASDVLLAPSRSESFGLVAAEAQACGLPVVAARVGGLAFAVAEGASGFLVDGWDAADYAAAAERVLADTVTARRLSVGGVLFSEQFSWAATADRLLELYKAITDGAGDRRRWTTSAISDGGPRTRRADAGREKTP